MCHRHSSHLLECTSCRTSVPPTSAKSSLRSWERTHHTSGTQNRGPTSSGRSLDLWEGDRSAGGLWSSTRAASSAPMLNIGVSFPRQRLTAGVVNEEGMPRLEPVVTPASGAATAA